MSLVRDDETRRMLNLLVASPTFVLAERDDDPEIRSLESIPSNSGFYWVAGTSTFAGGREVSSVFVVDSDAGGELWRVYWLLEAGWFESTDEAALEAAGLTRGEVFPFDWRLAVPLQRDVFHPRD